MVSQSLKHGHRNHGGSGGWYPPMFSDSYIARLNLYALITLPLPIEPPFTKPSSYASDKHYLYIHMQLQFIFLWLICGNYGVLIDDETYIIV